MVYMWIDRFFDKKSILFPLIINITLFLVIFTVFMMAFAEESNANVPVSLPNIKVVKVLIFAGDGAAPNSINGLVSSIDEINHKNLVKNTIFVYSITDQINNSTLSSQDVLIIAGGDFQTYLANPNIKSTDIKKFVSGGKGFVGICAGAYAASSYVDGYQTGWGIAPHVYSKFYNFDGQLPVSFTSNGQDVLNFSSTKNLYVANGPSLYKEGSYSPLASFNNTMTPHNGYAAILDDTYGSGRVILSSPHPELYPREPVLLANMIVWASGKR